jgi:ribose-phosphate pyrophosphokinase
MKNSGRAKKKDKPGSFSPNRELKFFSGSSNPALAKKICKSLGEPLGEVELRRFSDGELFVKLEENVRGRDVFIMQSLAPDCNNALMELLLLIDAARRASAWRITAVVPYYCYARQDRKDQPRVALSSKLVANLLTTAGVDRVLCMDLHVGQIQGFFDIPVDHLYAAPVLLRAIKKLQLNDFTVVSPDTGSLKRCRAYAKILNVPVAFIDKRRPGPNVAEVVNIVGEIKGRNAILVDDMIDTAGSLANAAEALKSKGAKKVYACATHPVLSGPAIERLDNSCIETIVVTNTIPLGDKQCDKVKVVSVGGLLADCIERIHDETSVSTLFVKTLF